VEVDAYPKLATERLWVRHLDGRRCFGRGQRICDPHRPANFSGVGVGGSRCRSLGQKRRRSARMMPDPFVEAISRPRSHTLAPASTSTGGPEVLRTAIATAFFCPTSRFARVTPV
jgi:hypothetical protein